MKKNSIKIFNLNEKGLKSTPVRELVLRIFVNATKPLSAEDIIKKVSGHKINDVTVYRTLTSFEKAQIIRQIDLRKESVFYELAENHHHHIVCKECGTLEDFETCAIEGVSVTILQKSKKFKIIDDHSFELFGICKVCIKNK